jgi:hypothetical protein
MKQREEVSLRPDRITALDGRRGRVAEVVENSEGGVGSEPC